MRTPPRRCSTSTSSPVPAGPIEGAASVAAARARRITRQSSQGGRDRRSPRPAMTGRIAYLALDLGTTELKGGLIATDGTMLAAGRAGYELDSDHTGRAEQDPETWWHAVGDVVARIVAAAGDVEIAALAVVGQGPTLVTVDAEGAPIRPAITWLDTRSGREAKDLE